MATKKKPTQPDGTSTKPTKPDAKAPREKSATPPKAASARAEPVVLDRPETPTKESEKVAKKPDVVAKPSGKEPTTPKIVEPAADEPSAAQPKRRSGFGVFAGLVGGGVVAAAIGFFLADYINPLPKIPDYSAEIKAVSDGYAKEISALQARIDELEATQKEQSSVLVAELAKAEAAIGEKLAELDATRARLTENLSATGGEINAATAELVAQYGAEIDALKAQAKALSTRLDEVSDKAGEQLIAARQKAGDLAEQVKTAASNVDLTLARERLNAAVASGKAYTDQLLLIAKEAAVEIPDILMNGADNGVAPMLKLQQDFPKAARNALKASVQAEAGPGIGAKLTAFLKAQLGARSLEEKEGNDPDAILSQAEAALGRGELQQAVDLVGKLPDAGKAEMAEWLAAANRRLAVSDALADFNQTLDAK